MSFPTNEELFATFGRIERLVNERLETESRKRKNRIEGAINWADLRCAYVEYVVGSGGEKFYRATVEEASPSASELCAVLRQHLEGHGLQNVDVACEW
jgi:hypothetical protein